MAPPTISWFKTSVRQESKRVSAAPRTVFIYFFLLYLFMMYQIRSRLYYRIHRFQNRNSPEGSSSIVRVSGMAADGRVSDTVTFDLLT